MAVGATRGQILALILRGGMTAVVIGMALGLSGAFLLGQVLTSLLFETQADDPVTFACVASLLAAVALMACFMPARRASRIDPLIALRYD